MRFLTVVLIATVAIGGGFVALAATDNIPFLGETAEPREEFVQERRTDRFDEVAAFDFLERQVELGPRPAGSDASRRLGDWLRERVPRGGFRPCGEA